MTSTEPPATLWQKPPSRVDGGRVTSLEWDDARGHLRLLDQTALPQRERYRTLVSTDDVLTAIRTLAVRGAPAVGLAGAYGTALAAVAHASDPHAFRDSVTRLATARPTATALEMCVRRCATRYTAGPERVLAEALAIHRELSDQGARLARRAADTLVRTCGPGPLAVLTLCNTGALAMPGPGTAFGAVTTLADEGRLRELLVSETRPLLQGARLTAWEAQRYGLPYRVCVDSAAPSAILGGLVDAVVVGADRIADNGDTANKVGTLGLALAAKAGSVPFFVVAPRSTVDPGAATGRAITIETRDEAEVTSLGGVRTAPRGAAAYNPAFDVTPYELITQIVLEDGPYRSRG